MPHSAFEGQTPDEVFFGIGDEVGTMLAAARKTARGKRNKENRAATCGVCVGKSNSGPLLLQRPRSRMSWGAALLQTFDSTRQRLERADVRRRPDPIQSVA
jgi:hypothetical protein